MRPHGRRSRSRPSPRPFARQSFTEKDINPFLPESEKAVLREKLRHARNEGLFTPPSLQGSIQLPGHNGGANWGSTAVDPVRGELYVVAKNMPTMLRLILSNEEPTAGGAAGGGPASPVITREEAAKMAAEAREAAAKGPIRYNSPYDFILSPSNGMTALAPPWSEITAYDLNTGEIKWRVPHGTVVPARRRSAFPRTPGRTCPGVGRSLPPAGWCSSPPRPTARSAPTTATRARWYGRRSFRRARKACRLLTR